VYVSEEVSNANELIMQPSKYVGITHACIFAGDSIFAYYDRIVSQEVEQRKGADRTEKHKFDYRFVLENSFLVPIYKIDNVDFNLWNNYLSIHHTVKNLGGGKICTIYLHSNLNTFYDRYIRFTSVILLILVTTLIVVFVISLNLQRIISNPILQIANTTHVVTDKKDYSIRLENERKDEIGTLMKGFNEMLSEIEHRTHHLVEAKEHAEQSAKAKEQFLANMSHEIRTPMNAIMGITDLLVDTSLTDKQLNYLDIIKSSSENLLVIINDILDLSKIESGKLVFEEGVIDPRRIIHNIVEGYRSKFEEKDLNVKIKIADTVPNTFIGDPVRFNQILLNLFTNAVKFTIDGGVIIGGDLIEESDDVVKLCFYVKDTGIGIPKEKFDSIFSSFTQATSETTRKFGGTGLGLSISKQLVEMQEGSISVESQEGIGSRFSFEIPFKKNKEESATLKTAKLQNRPATNKPILLDSEKDTARILLAEDNEINQMLVITLLGQWNVPVDTAKNGKIAVEMLQKQDYSLILMDVHMPEMDGYDATKLIRSELPSPKSEIPIIAMTASALKGEADRCLEAGMNDYISKPFNKEVLLEKITHFLKIPQS